MKHNAFNAYIAEQNADCANLAGGGVIVEEGLNWIWSRFTIEDTINHDGWDAFYPDRENA